MSETLTKTEDCLEKMTSGLLDNILFIKQTHHTEAVSRPELFCEKGVLRNFAKVT